MMALEFLGFSNKAPRMSLVAAFAVAFVGVTNASAMDLAKVNGKNITDRDLQIALSNLNEAQRQGVLKDVNTRRQVLSGVIDQELLVQEGEKSKLDQDEEYKDALAAFRRQYLASRILQKNLASKVSDGAAKKFYEGNKQRYSTDQLRALHILVSGENEARDILTKAKTLDAEAFQALAEKTSKDPSAKNNRGDLGYFGRDRMVSEFSDAAFGAKIGDVVGPVKTSFGYHVIKVLDRRTGKSMEYDEVELRVKNDLRTQLTQNYVSALKKQAKVEVNDKAVEKL